MTLLATALLVLQIPAAQTALARYIVKSLEKNLDGKIEFDGITFVPFNGLVVKGLTILDNHPSQGGSAAPQDTMFRCGTVAARFTLGGLLSNEGIQLKEAEIDDAFFALVIDPDSTATTNIQRIFRLKPSEKEKEPGKGFSIKKVSVKDFKFRMISNAPSDDDGDGYGIDWKDLDLVADIEGKDLSLSGGIMSGKAEKVKVREKCGLDATFSGEASVGGGRTALTGLRLRDAQSDVFLPELSLSYGGTEDFSDFVNRVIIDGQFGRSTLAFKTLSYFIPSFKDNGIVADVVSGRVSGPVNALRIDNFSFKDRTSGFGGTASLALGGVTDISNMALNSELKDFSFSAEGLGNFLSQWIPGKPIDLSGLAKGSTFVFNGNTSGTLADLKVSGTLDSPSGSARANLTARDIVSEAPLKLAGELVTDDLDIGAFIGNDILRQCSIRTTVSATLADGAPTLDIDTLRVNRLNLLGYDYSDIQAKGRFADNAFDGRIVCNDPNVNFIFQGLVNLSGASQNALYRFRASVGYADLHALNIDKREVSRVSLGSLDADFEHIAKVGLVGSVNARDLLLESANGMHDIGDIHIDSESGDEGYSIRLGSDFLDGSFNGSKSISSLIKDLQDLTIRKEVAALYEEPAKPWDGASYRVSLNFHDSRDVLSFLAPGAYIADSTSLRLRVTDRGRLVGHIDSPRIAFKDKYLRSLNLDIDNDDDALSCTVSGSELSLSPSLILKNDALVLYANDNNVGLGFNFNNMTDPEDRGELYLTGDLSRSAPRKPVIDARSLTSNLYIKGQQWRFDPASYHYSDGSVEINGLSISNGEQDFAIDGGISTEKADTLMVSINNVDLGLVNSFSRQDLGISGIAYGRAMVTSPVKDKLGLMVNVSADSTFFAGRPAGTVTLGGSWDLENGLLDYALRNSIDGNTALDARGYFVPKDKTLGLNAGLEDFDIGYAAPLLSEVFSEMGGKVTGQISADGPLDRLDLEGNDLTLGDGLLKVAFTQVPYYVSGPLHINSSGVYFDNVSVRDRYDGRGTISGGITYDRFKDIRMNTRIRLNDMEVVNLRESDGQAFYGHVFGTGRVGISGPFSSLLLDVEANTVKEGDFHIPLNGASATGGSDLLIFTEPVREVYLDPYEQMMNRLVETRKQENDLTVRVRVNATPEVEAHLEVDKATGNVFTGTGAGTIALEVRPSKDVFTINGDYTLSNGHYHFNAMNIASKDFTVLDGSSIKFNGDIMDSDLSITARYSLRTSLASLIADTTSVSTRRNVNCELAISGKLRNPELGFSITVPDLDPTTKSRVESALSTDDKVQKQFISLLVTNNFIPDDQSGIVNNSVFLTANVADLMANQLNNLLQKLDIPLDLGLNYAGSGTGTSLFDVALSTQLFNNRVIVNGSVGNRQYMSSGNGDVVGDLDIEIKMDKSGQVRMNLFSHSADEYTNYLDNSQRNGVGVTYQKEFNSLGQFFRDLFTPKSKREQEEEQSGEEEKVRIEVEKAE